MFWARRCYWDVRLAYIVGEKRVRGEEGGKGDSEVDNYKSVCGGIKVC